MFFGLPEWPGRADPGAGEDVGQDERDHQRQPEKSRQHHDLGESAAIPEMHEEQHHQSTSLIAAIASATTVLKPRDRYKRRRW